MKYITPFTLPGSSPTLANTPLTPLLRRRIPPRCRRRGGEAPLLLMPGPTSIVGTGATSIAAAAWTRARVAAGRPDWPCAASPALSPPPVHPLLHVSGALPGPPSSSSGWRHQLLCVSSALPGLPSSSFGRRYQLLHVSGHPQRFVHPRNPFFLT
jgi:hypothetical protein